MVCRQVEYHVRQLTSRVVDHRILARLVSILGREALGLQAVVLRLCGPAGLVGRFFSDPVLPLPSHYRK